MNPKVNFGTIFPGKMRGIIHSGKLFFLPLLFCTSPSGAQELLGIVSGNYSGINGTMINPTSIVKSPVKWEFNFAAAGLHADNNFLYIPKTNLFHLMNTEDEIIMGNEETLVIDGRTSPLIVTARTDQRQKQIYHNLIFRGPSFMICFGKWAVGMHTAVRNGLSVRGIPVTAATLGFEGLRWTPLHYEDLVAAKLRINQMAWGEVGLTGGAVITENEMGYLKAAATVKYLTALMGAYIQIDRIDYMVSPDTVVNRYIVDMPSANAEFGAVDWTDPVIPSGTGFGADIGATYVQKGEDENGYNFRIGASLLDIGSVNFSQTAIVGKIQNVTATFVPQDKYDGDTTNGFAIFLSNKFYGDSTSIIMGNSFSMALPLAASIQADVRFTELFFVNATLVQRITGSGPGVSRANILAVTPRLEHNWFELALPVVFYEYQHLRMGLAARAGYVTVGSDKIGSLLLKGNFSGTDIYASLKFFMDRASRERAKGRGGGGKNKSSKPSGFSIPCFKF